MMSGCDSNSTKATITFLEIKDNDIYVAENKQLNQNINYQYLEKT